MSWCKECHKAFSKRRRQERLVTEGEAYLANEAKRVRGHLQDPESSELRKAIARALSAASFGEATPTSVQSGKSCPLAIIWVPTRMSALPLSFQRCTPASCTTPVAWPCLR